MLIRKLIHTSLESFLNESHHQTDTEILTDQLLDKISVSGQSSLTSDQRKFLNGYNTDKEFVKYLLDDDYEYYVKDFKEKFNSDIIYDEYVYGTDEDIFRDLDKTVRVINKILKIEGRYVSSSNWASGYIWKLKELNKYDGTGIYLFLSDESNDLVIIERTLSEDDEIVDNDIAIATDIKSFYDLMSKAKL